MARNSLSPLFSILLAGLLVTGSACSRLDITQAEKAMQAGNYAEAYCIWRRLAEGGHPVAMYNIGWMYHNGFGLVVDDLEAAQWWQNAAESGLAEAELALGMLYYYGGKNVDRNLELAAEYLMPGVERGDEEAAMMLQGFVSKVDPDIRERFQALREDHQAEQRKTLAKTLGGKPVRVSASRANLRSEPNTSSRVIITLQHGTQLGELARQAEWVQVRYQGDSAGTAWIHASLITPIP